MNRTFRVVSCYVGLDKMLCRTCGKVAVKRSKYECVSRALKYEGLLVHDMRRTSIRNLLRWAFAERTIVEVGGHKTAHVFRRYDESDLAAVAEVLDRKHQPRLSHNPASGSEASQLDGAGSARIQ